MVLGEAKPVGDGPMAEIGGDELRFEWWNRERERGSELNWHRWL